MFVVQASVSVGAYDTAIKNIQDFFPMIKIHHWIGYVMLGTRVNGRQACSIVLLSFYVTCSEP